MACTGNCLGVVTTPTVRHLYPFSFSSKKCMLRPVAKLRGVRGGGVLSSKRMIAMASQESGTSTGTFLLPCSRLQTL